MDDLKKNIHAVLQSSKDGVRSMEFKKEYRNLTGEEISYRKFGYNTLEDFMKAIPDTVERIHVRGCEIYRAVSNDKTVHLQKLIAKQKSAPARKSKPPPSRRRPLHANENLPYTAHTISSMRRSQQFRYEDYHRKPKYEQDNGKRFENFRVTVDSASGGQRTTSRGDVRRSVEMKDNDANKLDLKPVSLSISKNNRMFQKAMKEAISSNEQLSHAQPTHQFEIPPRFQKRLKCGIQDGESYRSCLLNYLVKKSLPVAFQTLSSGNGFESSIQVQDQVYRSGACFETQLEAEQAAAKTACTELGLDPYETESNTIIDEATLKQRVQKMVPSNGLWMAKVATEYEKIFQEDPPDNLEMLIRSWKDAFKIGTPIFNRDIIYPLDPRKVSDIAPPSLSFTGKEVKIEEAQVLTIGKEVVVYMTFIYSCACFYVQPEWSCIYNIEEEMNKHCQVSSVNIKALERNGYCAALYTADNSWSRASILNIDEERNEVEVYYIDYGNTEKIHIDRITNLPESVAKYPVQAVLCGLFGIAPPGDEKQSELSRKEFGSLVGQEKQLNATTISLDETRTCQVILFNPDSSTESINELLVNKGFAFVNQIPESEQEENEPENEPLSPTSPIPSTVDVENLRDKRFAGGAPLTLPGERFWDVYVSYLSSTTDVIIRLVGENYSDELEKLESEIEKWFPEAPEEPIREGAVCGAQVDGLYHRVKVLALKGSRNKAECLFLDHGDSDDLYLDQLRVLEPRLNYLPYQAIPCVLAGLGQYSANITAIEKLFDMALGKTCVAEAVTKENKIYAVLYDTMGAEDVNINDVAAKCAMAGGTDLISSLLADGTETVSSSSLSQLSLTSSTTLETVMKESDSKDSLTTTSPTTSSPGSCPPSCLNPNSPAAYSVQNLTNGRTKSKSDLKSPVKSSSPTSSSGELSPTSTLSNKQSEQKVTVSPLPSSDSDSISKVITPSKNNTVITNCDSKSTLETDLWSKAAYDNLKPPETFQVPSSPKVFFGYVDSISDPNNFVVIPFHSRNDRDSLMNKLSDKMNAQPKSVILNETDVLPEHLYAGFSEDIWFRVIPKEIQDTGDVLVLYPDYGHFNLIKIDDIRPLPLEFWKLPYLALRCKLHGIIPADKPIWSEAAKYKFHEIAKDKCFACLSKSRPTEGENLSIILIDTSGETDICIHDVLVEYGYAKNVINNE